MNLALQRIFVHTCKWYFTCRKISWNRVSGFTSPLKEGVLWTFIALKNPSRQPCLNLWTLGLVASMLTITPPRWLNPALKLLCQKQELETRDSDSSTGIRAQQDPLRINTWLKWQCPMHNQVKTTSSRQSLRDDVFHGWTVSFLSFSLEEDASHSDCHDSLILFLMLFLISEVGTSLISVSECSVASFAALSAVSLPGTPTCEATQHKTTWYLHVRRWMRCYIFWIRASVE
jgi:hypothetical protein